MIGPSTFLDRATALRAAAGFTTVGDAVDACGGALRDDVAAMSWGGDPVGVALAARHVARAAELADAVGALAQQLRGLHDGVRTAAARLTGTDAEVAAATADLDLDRGRGAAPWG